jgi:hypothetical protein
MTCVSVRINYFPKISATVTCIDVVVAAVADYDKDKEEEEEVVNVIVAVFCNTVQEN